MRTASLLTAALAAFAALGAAAVAAAGTATVPASLSGIEVPPISSTVGTFVGTAGGDVRFTWRARIEHRPLSTGATVPVTGGRMTLISLWGRKLTGTVTGGSVSVVDRGRSCKDQLYRVEVSTTVGAFTGTLRHNRRALIGQCLITSATIRGQGSFTLPESFLSDRLP